MPYCANVIPSTQGTFALVVDQRLARAGGGHILDTKRLIPGNTELPLPVLRAADVLDDEGGVTPR